MSAGTDRLKLVAAQQRAAADVAVAAAVAAEKAWADEAKLDAAREDVGKEQAIHAKRTADAHAALMEATYPSDEPVEPVKGKAKA